MFVSIYCRCIHCLTQRGPARSGDRKVGNATLDRRGKGRSRQKVGLKNFENAKSTLVKFGLDALDFAQCREVAENGADFKWPQTDYGRPWRCGRVYGRKCLREEGSTEGCAEGSSAEGSTEGATDGSTEGSTEGTPERGRRAEGSKARCLEFSSFLVWAVRVAEERKGNFGRFEKGGSFGVGRMRISSGLAVRIVL